MDELKPCPFCGKPAKWEKKFLIGGIARCSDYQCIGAFTHLSRSASSGEWNRRPAEDALTTEVKRLKAEIKRMKIGLRKLWYEFRDRRRRPYIDLIEYQFYFAVEGKLEALLADDTNNDTKESEVE